MIADAVPVKIGGLLAAPAKQERIAALETDDLAPVAGEADQQGIDLGLGNGMTFGLFADTDPGCPRRNQRHDLVGDQPIVDHHVGFVQQTAGLEGQEFGVARPGTHEVDDGGTGG